MMKFYDAVIFLKIDRETCWKRRMATTPVHPFYFDEYLWPNALKQTDYVMEYLKGENDKKVVILDGTQETEQVMKLFEDFI